jgi:fumarylacetoacetase
MTFGGRDAIALGNGEIRRYLEDDDVVVFQAHCRRPGAVPIGFGECRGRIVPATAA